ncbi:centrosomal protein of 290 kDa isoform X1 [Crotalus tigris]|uniref:centrosomal protein of 290 kDa isoform X1 n=1 Tax=Crotalus tigris TaxID=88082 RepID=UPI00192FB4B5|nr:centrosomal protein of 290 kDa isoform X1 [Crotalus tigris]XP_039221107.1 centrosomal protein of 290 kDa isoform X1 [Crotalus tigris]XP_039221108.1 centrosomal protein of 290 kDa isoform X1 [Crotalus tigris]XP_039221109.1 centrosomal protein of 290 kDa isoform X1 [Crotalus tigris]
MAPILEWKKIMRVDPDALPHQEELADSLFETVAKVDGNALKDETPAHLIQLFKISQSLMKMKNQEVELALEEVEKAGEEQAKFENQLKTKVMKLEKELEIAQRSTGSRDTRFLRDEIRQLEKQLSQKDRELADMEKDLEKEKKANEQLTLRNAETENENSKLRRENEQFRQDVIDYQRQLETQKETLLSRRGEESDYRSQLSKKNFELVQYLDEIQNLTEANEKLEAQSQEMRKNLEESVQEMENMTDEYNKMKFMVQQSDIAMDQLRKEKEQFRLQVHELTEQLKAKNEEDDPLMAAVNEKVEDWKRILASKDDEIIEYQEMLLTLKEKLKMAQMDADKSNILALQQGVQERDRQIKLLTEQIEQYTKEMEKNVLIIEDLKRELQKDKSELSVTHQDRIGEMRGKLQMLEEKIKETERTAELAEADAREKDKELIETLKRVKDYETGIYGLEDAVAEIKGLKKQLKIRNSEIESLIKEVNKLEFKINDLLDENEDLREQLGLDPKTMIDLTELKKSKALKQQQYKAENQVLLKEIERLEEERVTLKQQIRKLAQEKGRRAATLGLDADDLQLIDNFTEDLKMKRERPELMSTSNFDKLKTKNEQILRDLFAKNTLNKNAELELDRCRSQKFENDYLAKELNEREKNLEQNRIVIMKLKSNLKELVQENKHLQQGMKEILQAIKDMQNDPGVKDGENALMIPSLERLVNAIELKNAEGAFDASLHLRAQVDQLTGRNEELRKELRESRKEAINFSNQLAKANTKIANLENEIDMLKKSEGGSIVFKSLNLPEGISPSSVNIINSQNEYLIHLLQEFENKEQLFKKLEEAIEEYKRKFAVIRHQQGLLYKEYQSEREHWQVANEKILQEKKRLEYQKEEDDIKIKEYTDLLDALEKDSDDTKQLFVDYSRKINVLRVNERSMTRQYATLLEMERHLRKENEKMKTEMVSVEVTVREKIGSLQRFKEMATFKIAALQKALDDSVPLNDLEMANKQYNELTAKYRDMLQKDNLLIQRTNNVERLEHENTSLKNQIESLNKELEITKEKLHTIEQAWEQTAKLGDSTTDKATKAITNSEIVSISKKITMLEMKELNERQRAEHCQRMYEHLRNTLKQAEERNFELETKFAELTKINLEAQKVEQSLRDELSNSVSKGINEVDKRRIMELEKSETELKIEASKLRELSDIAKTQVTALENRQQLRDKEVESLRMQILDYQVQSDEKTLIAKLHQHIVALQVSEATAITKLAAAASKLQKTEIANMRLEQKLDDKQQALYYARLEGRNRVKHLRQTVQSLRRQFSGALPLAQQEKFSKTMIQLQNDKLKTMEDIQQAQQERRNAENRAVELEMKLKGIEELVATLKDARGAQKVIEWHVKIEELRLQELKLNRELSRKNEEIKYLKNILSEYEQTINHLEEEIVQQGKFHEERQMAWDKREVELERQLDIYDSQKQDILSTAQKFNEAAGTVPDPSLPLPHQLEQALKTVREQSRTILEMQVTCKSVEEKLKEKEAALWKAEQNILSRDKVINELRLQLPASSEREKLVVQLDQIDDYTHPHALKIAHQTIANMQARLNQKEEILKKYQHLLAKAREEQEEIAKKHEEDLRVLHQKLDVHVDSSFNKFKQTALELIQKPSLAVPASKHLIRLAELEQTIAEQDSSLNSLLSKLKKTSSDLQKQKQITAVKIKEFDNIRAQLEEKHQDRVKKLQDEIEELRSLLSKMGKELLNVKSELEMQREANNRSPTTTMKNLVERLKNQLALKEKQQKALSKALLELRAEMTAAAEQQIISVASQKEAHMNVQQIVDKHTKELRGQIEDLNDQLLKHKDALKLSKNKESSLLDDMDDLNQELQKKMKAYTKVLREKDDIEKENEELKKQNKRLTSSIQSKADEQTLIDELQRKIKRMETELGKKSDESEKKNPREERVLKSPREELIRWEECKKWQTKADGMRNKLKEKEKEIESLSKQLNTIKELFSKGEKEKNALQKKLKSCSVTVDHVIGVRASESERELEELHKRNMDLENEIVHLKTQYAVPRDTVVEDLHLKNRYLQEKLLVLEKQLPRDTCSRPSTSGIGSDDQHQKEQELQKENLILSSENMELRFQLEQANKDLPRLKNQVADLKEMCELLKREKGETERKLGNVRGAGRSGKTIPELEKTIGLMKKVVERVQRENEELKRAPGVVSNEKVARLEQENEDLRSEMEKLKLHFGSELSARYELKTKGTEKIIAENDRIRKELKKEVENAEKLRMAKNNLEIINGKLNVELEETTKKLNLAENRIPKLEDADTKNWKSIVITRMFENKLKEMESEIARKNQTISDLKQKLQKPTESGEKNENYIEDYLKAQAEVLKSVPEDTKTEQEYVRENQLLRLTNDRLEKEKAELIYLMGSSRNQTKLKGDDLAAEKTGNYKLVAEVTDLKTQLKSSEVEQQRLHEEIKKLKNELDHFDPAFFEEIEDLKYNYNEEVKKNIILEEKLKTVSEKFGVQVDIPGRISID